MSLEHIQLAAEKRARLYMRGATPADANHLVAKLAEHVQRLDNELRIANDLIAHQTMRLEDLVETIEDLRQEPI